MYRQRHTIQQQQHQQHPTDHRALIWPIVPPWLASHPTRASARLSSPPCLPALASFLAAARRMDARGGEGSAAIASVVQVGTDTAVLIVRMQGGTAVPLCLLLSRRSSTKTSCYCNVTSRGVLLLPLLACSIQTPLQKRESIRHNRSDKATSPKTPCHGFIILPLPFPQDCEQPQKQPIRWQLSS